MKVNKMKDYKMVELGYKSQVFYVLSNGYCYNQDNDLIFILTKSATIELNTLLLSGFLSNEYSEEKHYFKYEIKYRGIQGKFSVCNSHFYIKVLSFIFNEHNIKRCDCSIANDIEKINVLFESFEYTKLTPIYKDIKKQELLKHYFDHLIM